MEVLSVDTTRLKESGEDILTLCRELNEEINSLYYRLTNINTLGWAGESSINFINIANIEKQQYIKIQKILSSYGKVLIKAAEQYDQKVSKMR